VTLAFYDGVMEEQISNKVSSILKFSGFRILNPRIKDPDCKSHEGLNIFQGV